MGNGIIFGAAMAEKKIENGKVRYSAAYSMGREFGKKCYCVTLTVSEGSDPLKSHRPYHKGLSLWNYAGCGRAGIGNLRQGSIAFYCINVYCINKL